MEKRNKIQMGVHVNLNANGIIKNEVQDKKEKTFSNQEQLINNRGRETVQPHLQKRQTLLIEVGAATSIIGIVENPEIKQTFPSIYADSFDTITRKDLVEPLSFMAQERYYGIDAIKYRNVLNIHNLLETGNYSPYLGYIKQVCEELYIDSRDFDIVFIIPSDISGRDRIRFTEQAFKILEPPKLTFLDTYNCVLSNLGMATGVVVDIGHFGTRIDGLFHGFPNDQNHFDLPIGGYHFTQRLVQLCTHETQLEYNSAVHDFFEMLRREHGRIAIDIKQIKKEINRGNGDYDILVELPDLNKITLNEELFECYEPLFRPELIQIKQLGVSEGIVQVIKAWERSAIPELLNNIVLFGNGAKIPGLIKRLELELKKQFAKTLQIKITNPPNAKQIVWDGARKLVKKAKDRFEWRVNNE